MDTNELRGGRSLMTDYCQTCSLELLKGWKGWPQKDRVPLLPILVPEGCRKCGNQTAKVLPSDKITWENYHSPYSTGLPDYWLLRAGKSKWGHPYLAEGNCPRCGARTVVSQMVYPNETEDVKHNCEKCGIVPVSSYKGAM